MKVSSIRWGVILVGIGLLFLAINLDYLSHAVWIELVALWPVLVIAIGVELIFSRTRFKFLGLISPLIIALAFIYAAWTSSSDYAWSFKNWRHFDRFDYARSKLEVFSYDLDRDPDLESLELDLDFGMGELWIGPTSNKLISGDFEYRYTKPFCKFSSSGGHARVRIKSREHKHFNIFRNRELRNDARIFVGDYIPLAIELDIAAAIVELDLSDLIIEKLNLDTGAAKVNLKLGCRSENVSVNINSGASEVIIDIPDEMGLIIDCDAALSSTNFKDVGLEKRGGKYESENYNAAGCRAMISIDSGVSCVEIQYY
jgi:hypothetical protein